MKNRNLYIFAVVFLLSACGGDVQETLGMRHDAPDEFAVERRPKLDVPPEFKLLPPVDGTNGLKESAIRDETREAVFGAPVAAPAGSAEAMLLQKTGAQQSNADIREVLSKEYKKEDPSLLEKIENIADDTNNKTLVDADKERARIADNKKTGKAIDDGDSATRSKSGSVSVLDRILGE